MHLWKGVNGYSGEKYRSFIKGKKNAWRLLVLLVFVCVFVCIHLYTNAFRQTRSAEVYHAIERTNQTEWKDRVSDNTYYMQYRRLIERNQTIPLLTLFTTWRDRAEKYLVHNLTSINWLSLRPFVVPIIFTNETSVAKKCRKLGWTVLPIGVSAAEGTPVLKFMFADAIAVSNSTFYGYANSDILFTNQLVETLNMIKNRIDLGKATLIVGKRTNVEFVTKEEASSWTNIARTAKQRGNLFMGDAEDYFLTQRTYPWSKIPEVVIGRIGYDNWLVYNARESKQLVIDITASSLAIHQTTEAGNYEGHANKLRDYNIDMLMERYNSINFDAGKVDCIDRETRYNAEGVVGIHIRAVPLSCSLVYDLKALYPVQTRVEKGINWNRLICMLISFFICLYVYREFLS